MWIGKHQHSGNIIPETKQLKIKHEINLFKYLSKTHTAGVFNGIMAGMSIGYILSVINKIMIPKRYYLHGDLYELIPNQYYCALCDSFEYKEHFYLDDFHKVNNQEKYIGSLDLYKNANNKFLKYNFRPSKSENLFSDMPRIRNGNFYNRLKKQRDRDDPIGDLANDSLSDKSFPTGSDSLEKIKTHLIVKNACDEAIQALKEAFDEFKNNRKYRSSISLKLRFEIFRNDNYRCQICGASAKDDGVKLELDHKIPKSEGGSDDKPNLWTLCFNCNRGKGKSKL